MPPVRLSKHLGVQFFRFGDGGIDGGWNQVFDQLAIFSFDQRRIDGDRQHLAQTIDFGLDHSAAGFAGDALVRSSSFTAWMRLPICWACLMSEAKLVRPLNMFA